MLSFFFFFFLYLEKNLELFKDHGELDWVYSGIEASSSATKNDLSYRGEAPTTYFLAGQLYEQRYVIVLKVIDNSC